MSTLDRLRQEPEDYLRALLTIYLNVSLNHATASVMSPALNAMLKSDPSMVYTIVDYCNQRNIDVSSIDPGVIKEVLAAPAPTLRNGVL